MSSSKTQMLLERTKFHKYWLFLLEIHRSRLHLTFAAFCLLSVICKQKLKQWNYSVDQSALLTGFQTDCLCRQYGSQTFLLAKRLSAAISEENFCHSQARTLPKHIALEYDRPLLSKLCSSSLFCRFPALKAFVRFNDSCVIILAVLKEVFFCCHLLWMCC